MLITSSFAASVATTCILLLIFRFLFQLIQRAFFHPLRSIPGPWANRVSELPATLALVRGKQHIYYRSLHEKYGPVVRVSPNELSFVSVEAREEIYGFRNGGALMEKSPIFLGAVGNVGGETGVSLAMNEEHTRQRKALGYLFTNTALLRHESILQKHIQTLVAVFKEKAASNQPIDFASWYTYIAFDITGDLCFASPFGCLSLGAATTWSTSVVNVFIAATWTQGVRRLSGVGTQLEKLLTWLFVPSDAASWRTIHLSNSREKTMHRLRNEDDRGDHPDFIGQILAHSDAKKSLTEGEMVLNMALFISAGSDTSATVLTGWTYFICTHPSAYERVAREVREALRGSEGPTGEPEINCQKVRNMHFLEATIREALRLFPPSAASQQRIVPAGGATIDGINVPEGTTVAVSPWATTRSKLNFWDPDGFWPERWMGEVSGIDITPKVADPRFSNDRPQASLPFGTGPRVCIGRNLAYMELRLILAHLLWNFDIELDRGPVDGESTDEWGLDGKMKPMKVFHSMIKPALWGRLKAVKR